MAVDGSFRRRPLFFWVWREVKNRQGAPGSHAGAQATRIVDFQLSHGRIPCDGSDARPGATDDLSESRFFGFGKTGNMPRPFSASDTYSSQHRRST
jgi:hypothetical protein